MVRDLTARAEPAFPPLAPCENFQRRACQPVPWTTVGLLVVALVAIGLDVSHLPGFRAGWWTLGYVSAAVALVGWRWTLRDWLLVWFAFALMLVSMVRGFVFLASTDIPGAWVFIPNPRLANRYSGIGYQLLAGTMGWRLYVTQSRFSRARSR